MSRVAAALAAFLLLTAAGCGPSTPASGGTSAKKITWAEYQKMDVEQKDDPSILKYLDDDAKKKLADSQRRKRR